MVAAARRCQRWYARGGGGRRREALKGEEVQAGRRGDRRGRWAVEELLSVRRVRGRGRGLEVHVRWEGGESTGAAARWADSWVGVTWLIQYMRKRRGRASWKLSSTVWRDGCVLRLRRRWCGPWGGPRQAGPA